jgi:hypothetical protein
MNTIFKVLVILVVAILVGGLFYGAVTATSAGTDQTALSERPMPADGEFERPDRDEAGGIQFPADAVKNLLIITVIAALYLNTSKWLKPALTKNTAVSS